MRAAETEPLRVPAAAVVAERPDKGSRFLAFVEPCATETAARERLAALGALNRDATHLCWAWRLGPQRRERASDAGEPRGTAGPAILNVLAGADLTDVLAVVVRWFGGTKLGKGGLARAYSGVVRQAIAELTVEERVPSVDLDISVPYDRLGALRRVLGPTSAELLSEKYGEAVEARVRVPVAARRRFEEALAAHGLVARPREL